MNRNTELHFSQVPQIHQKRSRFEESHSHKTTFNVGDIIPVYVDADILPGDTVQMDMAELVRMATPIYPIMDNLYMDIYWFFVPHRLVWDHWKEFWGENDDPWIQQTEYEIPQITSPNTGWAEGTIADYMGIPTKIKNLSVNALPFRAYARIWNDWFRDENLKKCCNIYTDETTRQGSNSVNWNYVIDTELGGKPCKAAKMHDYFTSCLPAPQKGPSVTIPISSDGKTPVKTNSTELITTGSNPALWRSSSTGAFTASTHYFGGYYTKTTQTLQSQVYPSQAVPTPVSGTQALYPTNLYVDLAAATATTINQLRIAFAIQKFYENAARAGSRYIEFIRSVFGVTSSDARMQRAEYLGGKRIPINIDQIIQTSSTDATTPQGNAAGFSCTINKDDMFTKSFEEHGTLMCCVVIRTEHTYQQGLHKQWTRKKWLDYYNPFFATLGETAVNVENIYATDVYNTNKEVFGYQEAWAEYRYKENRVSGYMRSNATGSLDVWHFADKYTTKPVLGTTWIDEPYENVDRTIAVTSQLTHQFIADFYFKTYYTRPMPVYSVPGLIDHV